MNAMGMLKGERVLVTGASGFIGARLARVLAEREGAKVTALVRTRAPALLAGVANVACVRVADVADARATRLLEGQQAVFHLAYDFMAGAEEQIAHFKAIAQTCARAKVGAFVQMSSIAVYDDWPGGALTEDSPCEAPGGAYKIAKRAMERALAEGEAPPHTILQPTIVYGPESPQWTGRLIEEFRNGVVVLPDAAPGLCQSVYVDDVVDAAILAASAQQRGRRYIINGPAPVDWRAFYEAHAALVSGARLKLAPIAERPVNAQASHAGASKAARALTLMARTVLGPRLISAARTRLARLKAGGRAPEYWPSAFTVKLYRASGSCSSARASEDIGYAPRVNFNEGMARIRAALGS